MINTKHILQILGLIYTRLKPIVSSIQGWLQIRIVRIFLQALILSFAILYLINSFRSVDLNDLKIKLNYIDLVWSFIITIVALFLGGLGWWLTLLSFGQNFRLREAMRIHSISNLAKYIPGYAWQLLSKGYLTRKLGVPARTIGLAMALELVQIFIGGIWLIILLIPSDISQSIALIPENNLIFSLIRFGLLGLFALFPILLPWIIRQFNPVDTMIRINSYALILATLSILLGWVLFGIAFWMIGDAVQSINLNTIPLFVFSLAVSFLIGLLIVIIPASIGVRESLMVFLLGSLLTAPIAVIVATLSRLVLTISELCFAGVVIICTRSARKPEKYPHFS